MHQPTHTRTHAPHLTPPHPTHGRAGPGVPSTRASIRSDHTPVRGKWPGAFAPRSHQTRKSLRSVQVCFCMLHVPRIHLFLPVTSFVLPVPANGTQLPAHALVTPSASRFNSRVPLCLVGIVCDVLCGAGPQVRREGSGRVLAAVCAPGARHCSRHARVCRRSSHNGDEQCEL